MKDQDELTVEQQVRELLLCTREEERPIARVLPWRAPPVAIEDAYLIVQLMRLTLRRINKFRKAGGDPGSDLPPCSPSEARQKAKLMRDAEAHKQFKRTLRNAMSDPAPDRPVDLTKAEVVWFIDRLVGYMRVFSTNVDTSLLTQEEVWMRQDAALFRKKWDLAEVRTMLRALRTILDPRAGTGAGQGVS